MFIFGFFVGLMIYGAFSSMGKDKEKQKSDAINLAYQADIINSKKIIREAEEEASKILAKAESEKLKSIASAEKASDKLIKEADKYKEKEYAKILKDRTQLNSDIEKHNNEYKEMKEIYFEKLMYHSALEEVCNYWISDEFQNIFEGLNATNLATQQSKLKKIFEKCEKLGIDINYTDMKRFEDSLNEQHIVEVEKLKAKEEQNRIREIMREEQRAEKVRAEELKKIEKEQLEIAKKMKENEEKMKQLQELEALKNLSMEQQTELENLKLEHTRIEEELASKERAKSMAELTKAGNVYVISNIGSFGENIYKVGMTRRLIPEDRVKELGDASVPFPFDIHMMIPSENAPELESKLHEELWHTRMNHVNAHKEFFSVTIEEIKNAVSKYCDLKKLDISDIPIASQWRETIKMKELGIDNRYEANLEALNDEDEDLEKVAA